MMDRIFWGITLAFVMGAASVVAIYLTGKDWTQLEWYNKLMGVVIFLMALAGLGMVLLLSSKIAGIVLSYAFGILLTVFLCLFWIQMIAPRYRRRDTYGNGIFGHHQRGLRMGSGIRVGAPHVR